MGKRKKGGLNPAEAFRKKMRKKELKRQKERRLAQRDARFKTMAPDRIMNELKKVERMEKDPQLQGGGISKDHARVKKAKLKEYHKAALAREKEMEKKRREKAERESVHIKGLSKIFREIPKEKKPKDLEEGDVSLPPGMEPLSADQYYTPSEVQVTIEPDAKDEGGESSTVLEEKKGTGEDKKGTGEDESKQDQSEKKPDSSDKAEVEQNESAKEGGDKGEVEEADKAEPEPDKAEAEADKENDTGSNKPKISSDGLLEAPPGVKNKGPERILRPHPASLVSQLPLPGSHPFKTPKVGGPPPPMQHHPHHPGMMPQRTPMIPGHMPPPSHHNHQGYPPQQGYRPPMHIPGLPGGPGGHPGGPGGPGGMGMPWNHPQGPGGGQHPPNNRMMHMNHRNRPGGPPGSVDPLDFTQNAPPPAEPATPAPAAGGGEPPASDADTGGFVPVNVQVRKRKQKLTVAQARAIRAQRKKQAEAAKAAAAVQEEKSKTAAESYGDFMSEIENLGAL
mmetsp:Transcript_30045/g.52753  ORF Transcript_30045/g.52753 Transcript_30045/m.52753 type:complete len:507 (-) Transcript_30045:100-1620(-)